MNDKNIMLQTCTLKFRQVLTGTWIPMLGCGDVGHTGLLVSSFSVNSLLLSSGFSKSGKAEKVFCV